MGADRTAEVQEPRRPPARHQHDTEHLGQLVEQRLEPPAAAWMVAMRPP
jgi:hypothetical protein